MKYITPKDLDSTIDKDSIMFFDEYIHTIGIEPVKIDSEGKFANALGFTRYGSMHILLSGVDHKEFREVCDELFDKDKY